MWVFVLYLCFFFFKQKTAYEMRISDWSSDVCSSDLSGRLTTSLSTRPSISAEPAGPERRMTCCSTSERFRWLHRRFRRDRHPTDFAQLRLLVQRSEERRVGNEGVSTC